MQTKYARGLPKQPDLFPQEDQIFSKKLEAPEIERFEALPSVPSSVPFDTKRIWYKPLRYLGAIIAIFSSFVSWVNSFEWFQNLRPIYVAAPMALAMIGSSVLLPDYGIILMKQKKRIMGTLIFISGILATIFCMITTTAALYNTHSWRIQNVSNQTRVSELARNSLDEYLAEQKRLIGEIHLQDQLISETQEKIATLAASDTMGEVSQVLQGRILGYQKIRQSYEGSLARINALIEKSRTDASMTPERQDFYGFIGRIFKGDPAMVEFMTASIPAIFLEIVAPVMVAVILFV